MAQISAVKSERDAYRELFACLVSSGLSCIIPRSACYLQACHEKITKGHGDSNQT